MKKLIIILAAAAELIAFSSCRKVVGEGMAQTETRTITGFNGVSSSIAGKINYKIDPVYKVEITAQPNILEVIETSNHNGYLLVKIRNGVRVRSSEEIVVNISAPSAAYLHLSGPGDLVVTGIINSTNLDMGISGTGNIIVPAANISGEIKASISGSGDISVREGSAKTEDLRISGSGKLMLDGVDAENAKTTISGSGDIYVRSSQTLDVKISGSGSVYYRGNPQISTEVSGSGRVRPL